MISYNKQSISKKDITFVSKVLKQDIITRGNTVLNFEKKISKLVKSKYSVSFNSASSGLTAACFALDLKKNDLVWTVPNTFVASASCALHFSAKIDFVDIDKFYKNISIDELEKKLAISKKKNKLPKLLITVHFGGQAPNQNRIFNLSRKYGFKIIEDASHSFGGSRKNEPIGSCKWADMTISSFHPVKTITTGEGGVACTNSKLLFERLKIYRNNGIVRDYKYWKHRYLEHPIASYEFFTIYKDGILMALAVTRKFASRKDNNSIAIVEWMMMDDKYFPYILSCILKFYQKENVSYYYYWSDSNCEKAPSPMQNLFFIKNNVPLIFAGTSEAKLLLSKNTPLAFYLGSSDAI